MKKTTIHDTALIRIPKIADCRGNLSVIEKKVIPFAPKRVYYLYDVPVNTYRGGHSHKIQCEFLIAVSGSFTVILKDGLEQQKIRLNQPDHGLFIPHGIWRELDHFSSGAVCLVLASDEFEEDDYIRDFTAYVSGKGR